MFTADYFPYIYLYNPRAINKDTTCPIDERMN